MRYKPRQKVPGHFDLAKFAESKASGGNWQWWWVQDGVLHSMMIRFKLSKWGRLKVLIFSLLAAALSAVKSGEIAIYGVCYLIFPSIYLDIISYTAINRIKFNYTVFNG
jgi:hypothetical protein